MRKLFVFVVLLLFMSLANAVTIVQVEGVVTSIEERGGYSFDDSVQVGTTFTETYYFSDLTDYSSDPERGNYVADYSVLSVGNYVFTSSEVGMLIECESYSGYFGRVDLESGDGTVYIDSVPYAYNSIDWLYNKSYFNLRSSLDIPTSDEFPSSFPDLAVFNRENIWSLVSNVETNDPLPDGIYINGEITSIEVIPEPCSVLLLGLGGIGVLLKRRG